jgi:hypothetical protein
MNALDRADNLEIVNKIAAVVNLFQSEFPDTSADLAPWVKNTETDRYEDPYSLDIAFHFYRRGWNCNSSAILMQIRFHRDRVTKQIYIIGVELGGYEYWEKRWQFSTIDDWQFFGSQIPNSDAKTKLKSICRQILGIFDYSIEPSIL